jgi:hypothetical protein
MKKLGIFFVLLLSGCAYHNPLDKADFRFQTLNTPPYILSSWYHINQRGNPLTVYVEKPVLDDEMRELAVRDKSDNVAYVARPCQYFQTDICHQDIAQTQSDNAVRQAIRQLQKKAATEQVDVKGL